MAIEPIKSLDHNNNMFDDEPYAIYLVRHAQPQWTEDGNGIDEPHLTKLGYRQAECLGQHLCRLPVTQFYTSSLLRARETAAPLARLIGREPKIAPWYKEVQGKPLDGHPQEEVAAYLNDWKNLSLDKRLEGPPGGESLATLYERLSRGLDQMMIEAGFTFEDIKNHRLWKLPDERRCIIMVGHTFASATSLSYFLNIPYTGASGEQFRIGWAAYNKIVPYPLGGGYVWRLKQFDVRDHLIVAGASCDDV